MNSLEYRQNDGIKKQMKNENNMEKKLVMHIKIHRQKNEHFIEKNSLNQEKDILHLVHKKKKKNGLSCKNHVDGCLMINL